MDQSMDYANWISQSIINRRFFRIPKAIPHTSYRLEKISLFSHFAAEGADVDVDGSLHDHGVVAKGSIDEFAA